MAFEVTASNSLGGKIEVRCLKEPQTAFEIEFDVTASNSLTILASEVRSEVTLATTSENASFRGGWPQIA